eukprot:CFRG1945T1
MRMFIQGDGASGNEKAYSVWLERAMKNYGKTPVRRVNDAMNSTEDESLSIDVCSCAEIRSSVLQFQQKNEEYTKHQKSAHDSIRLCYAMMLMNLKREDNWDAILRNSVQLQHALLYLWQETSEKSFQESSKNIMNLTMTYANPHTMCMNDLMSIMLPVYAITNEGKLDDSPSSLSRNHWILSTNGHPFKVETRIGDKPCFAWIMDELPSIKTLHPLVGKEDVTLALTEDVINERTPVSILNEKFKINLDKPGGPAMFKGRQIAEEVFNARTNQVLNRDTFDGGLDVVRRAMLKDQNFGKKVKMEQETLGLTMDDVTTDPEDIIINHVLSEIENQIFERRRSKEQQLGSL